MECGARHPQYKNTFCVRRCECTDRPHLGMVRQGCWVEWKGTSFDTGKYYSKVSSKRCWYCGKAGKMTRDHVVPKSKGGTSRHNNILPACYDCNQEKKNLSLEEYRVYRRKKTGMTHFYGEQ